MTRAALSICVTVKNRSRLVVDGRELRLFPNCVSSIASSVPPRACELVVADWGSDDWPYGEWLEQAAAPVPVQLIQMRGGFSRGRGLNCAAGAARGDALLFIDADCLISSDLIDTGFRYI